MPMLILRYQREPALSTSSSVSLKCDSTAPGPLSGSLKLKVQAVRARGDRVDVGFSDVFERFGNTTGGLGRKCECRSFVSKSMRISCVQYDVDVATTTGRMNEPCSMKWSSISAS